MNDTRQRFRIVTKNQEIREVTFDEIVEQILNEMKADHVISVLVVWETVGGSLKVRAAPDSEAVKRGIVSILYDELQQAS